MSSLTNSIPSEIGELGKLTYINITHNSLTGSIPKQLFGIETLRKVDFGHNSLTGTIPVNIGKLANLNTLDLAFNDLNGTIPNLENCTWCSSVVFECFHQNVNCIIYVIYITRKSLEHLAYSNILEYQHSNTGTKLNRLILSRNKLNGFRALPISLKYLQIDRNSFSGRFPIETICTLKNLTNLYADRNKFTGKILNTCLSELKYLNKVNLAYNMFTGPLPVIRDSPSISQIFLRENNFNETLSDSFRNTPKLKTLDISHQCICGRFSYSNSFYHTKVGREKNCRREDLDYSKCAEMTLRPRAFAWLSKNVLIRLTGNTIRRLPNRAFLNLRNVNLDLSDLNIEEIEEHVFQFHNNTQIDFRGNNIQKLDPSFLQVGISEARYHGEKWCLDIGGWKDRCNELEEEGLGYGCT